MRYAVIIPEETPNLTGHAQVTTRWHRIAFGVRSRDKRYIKVKFPPGVSVSGTIMLFRENDSPDDEPGDE